MCSPSLCAFARFGVPTTMNLQFNLSRRSRDKLEKPFDVSLADPVVRVVLESEVAWVGGGALVVVHPVWRAS